MGREPRWALLCGLALAACQPSDPYLPFPESGGTEILSYASEAGLEPVLTVIDLSAAEVLHIDLAGKDRLLLSAFVYDQAPSELGLEPGPFANKGPYVLPLPTASYATQYEADGAELVWGTAPPPTVRFRGALLFCAESYMPEDNLELCSNGLDDNCDAVHRADCGEPSCNALNEVLCENHNDTCSNGSDDDGDGYVDCCDFDCVGKSWITVCPDHVCP